VTPTNDPEPEPEPDPTLAEIGYAQAVAELDQILAALDRDNVDVDDLARQVRRAAELVRHCRGRIAGARTEVEQIVAELEDLADS
jgi:exodeoxyribonuclease VII small subunit